MSIRYICRSCESALKIKEEKAGTNGKCPKCKTEFVVPFPDANDIEVDVHGVLDVLAEGDAPVDYVDMPIELTPEIEDSADFDPLDVLNGPTAPAHMPLARSAPAVTDKKPSVAELMRDFNAGKKKERKRDSASEVNRPANIVTAEQTIDFASNALSRTYQKKRDAVNSPAVSAKDAKAAEKRALLLEFLMKKAGPAFVAVVVVVFAYYSYMTADSYSGPQLYHVSGKILSQTTSVKGLRVQFVPVVSGSDDTRSSAEGVTAADGSFELTYAEPHKGAPAGSYQVVVCGIEGIPLRLLGGPTMVTVSESGENVFEIKL